MCVEAMCGHQVETFALYSPEDLLTLILDWPARYKMFLSWILLILPVFFICRRYWGNKVKKRGTSPPSQSLHFYGEKAQTNQITWKSETENLSPW